MLTLIEQVEQAVGAHSLWRDGQAVLVAVSGGMDSMVLLQALHRLAPAHRWQLVVAHFNHRLRGRSSDADERFVRAAAEQRHLRFVAGRADVRAFSQRWKVSVEMAARELRHKFLARTARRLGLGTVVLAHHADDQVELFFLRLLRGAGSEGLAGMKWKHASPSDARLTLVRPLLECTRKEIQRFARQEGLRFRHDASNVSREILRNRLRHELLPLLARRYQPALARTTLRVMDILRAEAEFVAQTAAAWLRRKQRPAFARLPVAVQRQVVQTQLIRLPDVTVDFDLVEALRLEPETPVTVRPGLAVARDRQGMIHRQTLPLAAFNSKQRPLRLTQGGACEFAGLSLAWRVEPWNAGQLARLPKVRPAHEGCEYFDADKIGSHIVLRHWRRGDRFQPIGMARPVKLQDWFTNRKVPRALRHQLVVATTNRGEIFWVEGQRIGERFKLDAGTLRCLRWTWRRG
jgi:tRNA(Ile)-lysidine synthase